MAPVAGMPPNSGEAILAMPWATSSTLGLCWSPLIRSATTADINDSIAPSKATVNAGATAAAQSVGVEIRQANAAARWESRQNAFRWSPPADRTDHHHDRAAATRATIDPGMRFANSAKAENHNQRRRGQHQSKRPRTCRDGSTSARMRPMKSPGIVFDLQTEEILDLGAGNQHGNAVGKADRHGPRNELDALTRARSAPAATSMTPASIVHTNSPSMPCWLTIAGHDDDNAPVGPPICVFEPPSGGNQRTRRQPAQ